MTSVIGRVGALSDRLHRALSRSVWSARLLRANPPLLPEAPAGTHGLLMVQVDGLSRRQFDDALASNEMPFLRGLRDAASHRVHDLYSGVPSTTPAVQGELLYGVKTAVPAFGFVSHETGEAVRMLDAGPAERVQSRLAAQGHGLLEGGAAYADIFDGGANSGHFCSSRLRWERAMRWRNVVGGLFVAVTNLFSIVRAVGLLLVELLLAVVDCVRGVVGGRNLLKELAFVPSRVAVCVLLREFVRVGAEIDLARGVPVVHLNLLGYDEQAHRRGPSSAFAHWSLRGIDTTIRRLHDAAHRSPSRHYELVVYSDHGQEDAQPYQRVHGRPIEAAVAQALDGHQAPETPEAFYAHGEQISRARWLFSEPTLDALAQLFDRRRHQAPSGVRVVAVGPLGFVYLPQPPAGSEERDAVARALVCVAKVPLVLARAGAEGAHAWTEDGVFELPRDAAAVLGEGHPHLADAGVDLAALCQHRDSGDFVICGFSANGPQMTFPMENGSHGGPGYEETHAFALLPDSLGDASLYDATRYARGEGYLRPLDLRRAAFRLLGRGA